MFQNMTIWLAATIFITSYYYYICVGFVFAANPHIVLVIWKKPDSSTRGWTVVRWYGRDLTVLCLFLQWERPRWSPGSCMTVLTTLTRWAHLRVFFPVLMEPELSSYLLFSRTLPGHNRNRLPVENHVPWRQNSRCFCVICYESWSDWSETNSVILRSSQVACALQLSVVQSATCTLCNASLVFPASTQVLSCPFWSSICFPCCFGTKDLQTEEGSLIASEGWLLI